MSVIDISENVYYSVPGPQNDQSHIKLYKYFPIYDNKADTCFLTISARRRLINHLFYNLTSYNVNSCVRVKAMTNHF